MSRRRGGRWSANPSPRPVVTPRSSGWGLRQTRTRRRTRGIHSARSRPASRRPRRMRRSRRRSGTSRTRTEHRTPGPPRSYRRILQWSPPGVGCLLRARRLRRRVFVFLPGRRRIRRDPRRGRSLAFSRRRVARRHGDRNGLHPGARRPPSVGHRAGHLAPARGRAAPPARARRDFQLTGCPQSSNSGDDDLGGRPRLRKTRCPSAS